MEQTVPMWMVSLIIVFAVALAVAFGAFIYHHGVAASYYEEWSHLQGKRVALERQRTPLTARAAFLSDERANPILDRQSMIEAIRASNQEEMVAIREILLPQHSASLGEIRINTQKHQEAILALLADARRAQEDLQTEKAGALRASIQADNDRLRLRQQVQEQSRELERMRKEFREVNMELENDIAQRQERVQELVDRIDTTSRELTSDGQLLRAHATSGFVVINRGRQHQLPRGTRFIVYNRRGGRNVIKGEIEVQEVHGNIAVCRVLEENDPNDPLIPGDHIHNRVYRHDEIKHFVIVGDFDQFNRDEIARFVRDGGGRVDDALSTRTHYLVAGDGPEAQDALDQASLLGVTVLSERQAVDLVREPLQFRIRSGMTFVLAGQFDEVSASVIRSYIRASGGVIEDRVGDGLNVLIAGSGAADEIAEARVVGARVISQSELRHLIGGGR